MQTNKLWQAMVVGLLPFLGLAGCGGGGSNRPVISAFSAVPSVVPKGGTVHVSVSATDPHNRALTYAWQTTSGWTITPSADGTTATVTAPDMVDQQGTISVQVSASTKDSVAASILVATSSDRLPVISSLSVDQTKVLPGTTIHALVAASDPDNDTLTYTWASSDVHWMVTSTGSGAAATILAPETNGASTTLSVTVDDGQGGMVTGSVLLSTSACGAGALNCDNNDANGCETDTTTTTNCGGCGVKCATGQVCDHGSACRAPSSSCEAIIDAGLSLGDGDYYILPPGATDPIKVFCDMTTDGGGWTGFYAGINGANNAFNHFEYTDRDCTDPDAHCLQRVPASETSAEIMSTCGAASVGFHMSPLVATYFSAGAPNYYQPVSSARTIAGTVDTADLVIDVFTGATPISSASLASQEPGWVLGNPSNPGLTFASAGSEGGLAGFNDYCNGVFDEHSPVKLFYRTKVDHLTLTAIVNEDQGTAFPGQVTAYDAQNQVITTFADTVHFTASNADVTLPADYTFQPATDAGSTTVSFTLTGAGQRTITVTDVQHPSLKVTLKVQVATIGTPNNPAPECSTILQAGAADGDGTYNLNSGIAFCDMTTDGGGWTQIFNGKNGSANLQSYFDSNGSDCAAPGTPYCQQMMNAVGSPEMLATCGNAKAAFFVTPPAAAYFQTGAESGWVDVVDSRVIAGNADLTTLTSVFTGGGDASTTNGNGYNGFILGNPATGKAFGGSTNSPDWNQCNGAADTGSALTLAYRNRVDHFVVSTLRNSTAGTAMNATVTAVGKNNQPVLDYGGTVHFTSGDGAAVLPGDLPFNIGDGFAVGIGLTLNTAGAETVTATDTAVATLTGNFTSYVGTQLGSPGVPAASCAAILAGTASNGDGTYTLTNVNGPYLAYCDMTTDGGGWTLVLKAKGANTTFSYGSPFWTNNGTVNLTFSDFDLKESKLDSYNTLGFTQVLADIGLDPLHVSQIELTTPAAQTSMLSLMQGPTIIVAPGRAVWEGAIAEGSLQPTDCGQGFNLAGSNGMAVRIGMLANQENDCNSDDSRIGIGGAGASCGGNGNISVGDISSACNPDHTYESLAYFGWVLVR